MWDLDWEERGKKEGEGTTDPGNHEKENKNINFSVSSIPALVKEIEVGVEIWLAVRKFSS